VIFVFGKEEEESKSAEFDEVPSYASHVITVTHVFFFSSRLTDGESIPPLDKW